MYFNCSAANPSRERCSVPFSCCLRDADEVRTASSGGPRVSLGEPRFASLLPYLGDVLSLETPPQQREYHWQYMGAHLPSGFGDPRLGMVWWGQDEAPLCGGVGGLSAGRQGPCQPCHPQVLSLFGGWGCLGNPAVEGWGWGMPRAGWDQRRGTPRLAPRQGQSSRLPPTAALPRGRDTLQPSAFCLQPLCVMSPPPRPSSTPCVGRGCRP